MKPPGAAYQPVCGYGEKIKPGPDHGGNFKISEFEFEKHAVSLFE